MTTYGEVMNSGLLYGICYVILALVAGICVLFYMKSKKQAIKLGVTNEEIKAIMKSSMVLTIVPSLSIVVGLFSLTAVVGVPWSQLRLSVIGSFVYELMAAQMTTTTMGIADTTTAMASSATVFANVMFVMSICCIGGPIVNAIVCKPLTQGLKKAGESSKFTAIRNSCFMIAMFSVTIPIYCAKGIVTVMVIITSAICSELITKIAIKLNAKWLHEFNLSLCLIIGMVSSILWTSIFA